MTQSERDASASRPKEPHSVCAHREAKTDEAEPERHQRRGIKGNHGQACAEYTDGAGQYDETLRLGSAHVAPRQSPEKPASHHHDQDRRHIHQRHACPSDDQPQVRFRLGNLPLIVETAETVIAT